MAVSPREVNQENDYSRKPVPHNARLHKMPLTMAWWGCCSALFWIILAAAMSEKYGTVNTIIGVVAACIVYAVVCGIITHYAIKTGVSVAMFSRMLLGNKGAMIATLTIAATATIAAVFEGAVIAHAATFALPWMSYNMAVVAVIVISLPLVFGRVQTWLNKLNGFLLPFYILGLIMAVGLAIHKFGYSNTWLEYKGTETTSHGWWYVFAAYMGVWPLMMFCLDFSRFGKREDAKFHALFNFGIPFYAVTMLVSGLVGIFIAHTVGVDGPMDETVTIKILISLMGLFGLFFVAISQIRINSANMYMASTNFDSFYSLGTSRKMPTFLPGTIIITIIFGLMLTDVFSYLMAALAYQGVFVVAWVSAAVSYMVFFSKNDEENAAGLDDSHYPSLKFSGIFSWAVGIVLGIYTMHNDTLITWSAPITFFSTFFLYYILKKNESCAYRKLKA